jgi:hypothetical protein
MDAGTLLPSVYDRVGLSDVQSTMKDLIVSASDGMALGETLGTFQALGEINVSDTVALQDDAFPWAFGDQSRIAVGETIIISGLQPPLVISGIYDRIGVAEALDITTGLRISVSQGIILNDDLDMWFWLVPEPVDTGISVGETVTIEVKAPGLSISSVYDGIGIQERTWILDPTITMIAVGETVTVSILTAPVPTLSVAEDVGVSESLDITTGLRISLSDGIVVDDGMVMWHWLVPVPIVSSIFAGETLALKQSLAIVVYDGIQLGNPASVAKSIAISVSDGVSTGNPTEVARELVPSVLDRVGVAETVSAALTVLMPGAGNDVGVSESLSMDMEAGSRNISVYDEIGVSESRGIIADIRPAPVQWIGVQDVPAVYVQFPTPSVLDRVGIHESVSAAISIEPSRGDGVGVSESVSVQSQNPSFVVSDNVGARDEASLHVALSVFVYDRVRVRESSISALWRKAAAWDSILIDDHVIVGVENFAVGEMHVNCTQRRPSVTAGQRSPVVTATVRKPTVTVTER